MLHINIIPGHYAKENNQKSKFEDCYIWVVSTIFVYFTLT